ncbi:MAG: nucleoside-diphosphate kinase [Deltaproteobacteria bacterium RIFCSPLOWO2_02_FULL_44_10]|nr:MAG: nucleoside-diphosphate kinase [Deltaproteobacteria bacterium RIFCSPHIGHO2_02_FULL_44_16]OGQ46724.1 MAG: nucleoside-diphosphate kinase [Deltaproteobacteria bacterium RIFCSPLOWO2_02_FULL_44_10]
MKAERTLAMIKPDAVEKGVIAEIIKRIEDANLKIVGLKMHHLSKQRVEGFYAVHKTKPFFNALTTYMASGPSIALVLEGEKAISTWRTVMGATNPEEAQEGTIRGDFGTNIERNAVHGSDASDTATFEISYFFDDSDLVEYEWV